MATNSPTQQKIIQPGIWVDGRCRCHSAWPKVGCCQCQPAHRGCTTVTPLNLWAAKCSSYHLLTKRTTAEDIMDIMMICENGKIVAHVVVVVRVVEIEAKVVASSRRSSTLPRYMSKTHVPKCSTHLGHILQIHFSPPAGCKLIIEMDWNISITTRSLRDPTSICSRSQDHDRLSHHEAGGIVTLVFKCQIETWVPRHRIGFGNVLPFQFSSVGCQPWKFETPRSSFLDTPRCRATSKAAPQRGESLWLSTGQSSPRPRCKRRQSSQRVQRTGRVQNDGKQARTLTHPLASNNQNLRNHAKGIKRLIHGRLLGQNS